MSIYIQQYAAICIKNGCAESQYLPFKCVFTVESLTRCTVHGASSKTTFPSWLSHNWIVNTNSFGNRVKYKLTSQLLAGDCTYFWLHTASLSVIQLPNRPLSPPPPARSATERQTSCSPSTNPLLNQSSRCAPDK